MRLIETISTDCFNCGQKHGTLEIALPEGRYVFACDDCAEEQRRVEADADKLAALPSCAERQHIIDGAATVQRLVNQLRAHDQTGCAECAAVQAVACDDCGRAIAPHCATYDAEFRLRSCVPCALKQARLDMIVAEHNAEIGAVA